LVFQRHGGHRWQWCRQREQQTHVPYIYDKHAFVYYILHVQSRHTTLAMMRWIRKHWPRLYRTYFNGDHYEALRKLITRARFIPSLRHYPYHEQIFEYTKSTDRWKIVPKLSSRTRRLLETRVHTLQTELHAQWAANDTDTTPQG
jgi:hypothetical protein